MPCRTSTTSSGAACRGDARNTSMPNREMSNRDVPVAIISIAQQARPKVTGHTDALRTVPANFYTVVSRKPDVASSMPMALLPSVPLEPAAAPLVHERHGDQRDEGHHGDDAEHPEHLEGDRPGVHEDDLDVEDDEAHRDQVVLDREPAAAGGRRGGVDTALVGLELGPVVALGAQDGARADTAEGQHTG